jgi:hypothetical protein
MKEQIQQLIAAGHTKDALDLLVRLDSDALLLQARYNNGEKQFNLGLIDFNEWGYIQAKVNHAALEMAGKVIQDSRPVVTGMPSPEIFLIYNQKDIQSADAARRYLKRHGVAYVSDFTQINAGQEISEFVANKALKSQFILILVSLNSLKEGWTGLERHLDILSNSLIQRNVIPLSLDNSLAQPRIVERELARIEEQLDEIDEHIQQKLAANQPAQDLEAKRTDLTVLHNNLPKIVQRLRSVSAADISGNNFEPGMKKVLQTIQRTVERAASVAY